MPLLLPGTHLGDHSRLIPSLHQLTKDEAEKDDHDDLHQIELERAVYRRVSLDHPSSVGC